MSALKIGNSGLMSKARRTISKDWFILPQWMYTGLTPLGGSVFWDYFEFYFVGKMGGRRSVDWFETIMLFFCSNYLLKLAFTLPRTLCVRVRECTE